MLVTRSQFCDKRSTLCCPSNTSLGLRILIKIRSVLASSVNAGAGIRCGEAFHYARLHRVSWARRENRAKMRASSYQRIWNGNAPEDSRDATPVALYLCDAVGTRNQSSRAEAWQPPGRDRHPFCSVIRRRNSSPRICHIARSLTRKCIITYVKANATFRKYGF